MRSSDHWNYQGAGQTQHERQERSQRLGELRELESLSFALGMASGTKWRGRKPRARHPNHPHHKAETGPLIKFDIE